MQSTAHSFNANVDRALADSNLQDSLDKLKVGFSERRRQAAERLPEFEALRDRARDIKNHALANLDFYLEEFERKVLALGGHVHWAPTAADARGIILELCQGMGARTVAKSKSMIAEEIALNEHLEAAGIAPIETDLGEYIIQLRHEPPSHIIAPAVHLTKDQVADTFLEHHAKLGFNTRLTERNDLVAEARHVLRQKFLDADVGLTGANFLVAETGSSILVTNEGNADLSNTLPRMHIVLASIEKVIPTLEDLATLLRVLARSATGQESSAYTTLNSGPRRPGDLDGPEHYHVVLLDNGRSSVLGTEMRDIALHPLWRLHESLPCVRRDRRPCLWLGLSRPAGRRADAATHRRERSRQPAQRLDLLRPLRKRLPGAHPSAQADATLARARIRAPSHTDIGAPGAGSMGLLCPKAGALSPADRHRQPRAGPVRPRRGALPHFALGRRLDALP